MPNSPNTHVRWLPIRPEFSIKLLHSTSTNRGYHESHYEVISRFGLDPDDFKRLDECNLLGMGQQYDVLKTESFEDVVPPVVTDDRTGLATDEVPRHWNSEEVFTKTNSYSYFRYSIRRICDSGD